MTDEQNIINLKAMDDQFKSHQYKEQFRRNIRGDQDRNSNKRISCN